MSEDLAEELEQVETELAEKLAEAARIGDCLVVLGNRLKREPWQWVLGGHPNPPPRRNLNPHRGISDQQCPRQKAYEKTAGRNPEPAESKGESGKEIRH